MAKHQVLTTSIDAKAHNDKNRIQFTGFKSLGDKEDGAESNIYEEDCVKNQQDHLTLPIFQESGVEHVSDQLYVSEEECNEEQSRSSKCLACMAACLTIMFTASCLYMFGVLLLAFVDNFDGQLVKMTTILSLQYGLNTLLGPMCSLFIDRFSCRASMVCGGLLWCVSFIGSAFIKDINGLIPVLGVMGGVGSCLSGTPVPVIISYNFGKHRAKFVTISQVVIGASMFLGSPFAIALLDMYALRGTLLIMAGLVANICVCGMLCKPNKMELYIQRQKQISTKTNMQKVGMFQSLMDTCKQFSFVCFLLSTCCWNFVLAINTLQLPYFISETKSHQDIAGVMMVFSILNLAGRILGVVLVFLQRINLITLHIISLGLLGAFVTAFPLYNHLTNSEYVFASLCGLFTGLPKCLMVPISLQLANVSRLSAAHGLSSFACGVGVIIGPPIASFCYESSGSYNSSFIVAGAVALAGAAFSILTAVFEKRTDTVKIVSSQ